VLLLLAGCPRARVDYSKQARFPDDEGQVTDVSFEQMRIEGKRRHPIDSEVQSFSTYNGVVTPLLSWKDKYVHVGLNREGNAIWIAGVGVIDRGVDPPVVHYTNGLLKKVEGHRMIFADGTVLRVAPGVQIPAVNSRLNVTIDANRHLVVDLPGRS
jgi:hypothetical protein